MACKSTQTTMAPNEQFRIHNMIRSQVFRYYKEKLTVESRGYYTAVFIIEK